jgi:hypothetical protein
MSEQTPPSEFRVGVFTLRGSYANDPSLLEIAREDGEAGDFRVSDFEAHIAEFFQDRF